MTFPSLGGNLADPWVDGTLVSAAAMKTNTTDKLNALADSLLVKTSRVACTFTVPLTAVPNSFTPTPLNPNAITASSGGSWSIATVGAYEGVQCPANGIYQVTLSGTCDVFGSTAQRNQILIGSTGPVAVPSMLGKAFLYVDQDTWVVTGTLEVTGVSNNKAFFEALQVSGVSKNYASMTGRIVKVSD